MVWVPAEADSFSCDWDDWSSSWSMTELADESVGLLSSYSAMSVRVSEVYASCCQCAHTSEIDAHSSASPLQIVFIVVTGLCLRRATIQCTARHRCVDWGCEVLLWRFSHHSLRKRKMSKTHLVVSLKDHVGLGCGRRHHSCTF